MSAHQRFIAENYAGGRFDDRLKCVLDDELGKRDDLIVAEAAMDECFCMDGGHAGLRNGVARTGRSIEKDRQRSLSPM
ncbi:hypothetical protein J2Z31_001707 [Sinorhizobium kostiense]|uniref:Uncharacterized protein n=1 Tax=Sinorhizobium kostiense TaxID=76747 RepID=A0ABS4QYW8_9HYPH|nr:hypothetical protein [Sinorhizobium kostiense]